MKQVIVAKFTQDGKEYIGKREVKLYDETSKVDSQMVKDANVGLTLRSQTSIRNAVKAKNGLKTVSSGGVAVDLSNIESV